MISAAQKPEILQPFKDAKLPIGGTVTFVTKVRGFPVPEVVWKINDEEIQESENIIPEFTKPMTYKITLKDVPENFHEGTVTLTATNVGGEASTQSKLTVKGRAPEFISKPIKCTTLAGNYRLLITGDQLLLMVIALRYNIHEFTASK